ncbi:PilW family protein [Thalassomonas haliotis]|uniref:PilW family protein n=1 Tax=Thalassomonas haliotis TaxID=485448 RepID=UPI00235F1539|nr:PilW family protein [Thalassomonas haliotis]
MIKKQQGFSLIELFISLATGLVLFAGVLSVFVGIRATSSETTTYGELQENGRFAINLLTDDLLRQGFWGELPESLSTGLLVSSPAQIAGDCVGDGINNSSFPLGVGHFRALWGTSLVSAANMGCIDDAKTGSDLLQIKRVISAPVAAANVDSDRYYLIANANSGAIFAGDAGIPTINDGQIWEYQHHIYYISEYSQGGNTVPVLMQGQLRNATLPPIFFNQAIDGIEMIRFMYGVDSDSDGIVNAFIPAGNMLDTYWDNESDIRILAVKIFVLARSILPDSSYENLNTYHLGDLAVNFINGGSGDNYRRMLFSSTITLPNARVDTWP